MNGEQSVFELLLEKKTSRGKLETNKNPGKIPPGFDGSWSGTISPSFPREGVVLFSFSDFPSAVALEQVSSSSSPLSTDSVLTNTAAVTTNQNQCVLAERKLCEVFPQSYSYTSGFMLEG